MNFDNLADRLYGLAPNLFVSERTAAEKQARIDGDRELAGRIHKLTKPTTVGWLANQLVRGHPEEIGPLLALWAGLREATANLSREKLQELMRLQHQVIVGLIKQARIIARDTGQRISEDAVRGLETTLRAAKEPAPDPRRPADIHNQEAERAGQRLDQAVAKRRELGDAT